MSDRSASACSKGALLPEPCLWNGAAPWTPPDSPVCAPAQVITLSAASSRAPAGTGTECQGKELLQPQPCSPPRTVPAGGCTAASQLDRWQSRATPRPAGASRAVSPSKTDCEKSQLCPSAAGFQELRYSAHLDKLWCRTSQSPLGLPAGKLSKFPFQSRKLMTSYRMPPSKTAKSP